MSIVSALFKSIKFIWNTLSFIAKLVLLIVGVTLVYIFVTSSYGQKSKTSDYNYIKPEPELKENARGALYLSLGKIYNRAVNPAYGNSVLEELGYYPASGVNGTKTYIDAIDVASKDNQVTGVVIDLSKFDPASTAIALDFAKAIERFKISGKPVIAYSNRDIDSSSALVASASTKFYQTNRSSIYLERPYVSVAYLGDFFDKFGIKSYSVRSGSFDSAIDGDLGNTMSVDVAKNANVIVSENWKNYFKVLNGITGKTFTADQFTDEVTITNYEKGISPAIYQESLGLVEKHLSDFQLSDKLISIFGKKDKSYNKIPFNTYLSKVNKFNKPDTKNKHIAVFNANGLLKGTNSSNSRTAINGNALGKQLLKFKKSDNSTVSGIIIRVNSAGGEISDAQKLNDAVAEVVQSGIPVYVYAEDFLVNAAYLAFSNATKIYINDLTIVGGISVANIGALNIEEFNQDFKNINFKEDEEMSKLVYYQEAFPYPVPLVSSRMVSYSTYHKERVEYVQQMVNGQHNLFKFAVKDARKGIDMSAVDQGQVFAGQAAVEAKLVDKVADFYITLIDLRNSIASKDKDGLAYSMQAFNYDNIGASSGNLNALLLGYIGDNAKVDIDEVAKQQNLSVQQLNYQMMFLGKNSGTSPISVCTMCLTK